ncbi:N-acetylglutamate synthase-like GNAT family acetyltransferase [Hydrogenispora ethanolica]|uniref:N-acetylglutamate synthase-like GNAT family acetyltransferase n=1 Tax=Hydrogenispora ethanolica TaxID=1082276 RepID=A0A4R1QYI6_HYDET|nr:GNAT family N-acetyltransferase [Hydrogenispora ethanolica]TCL57720.1 N-acetylglutamate synthase-like GNAT family acetyltransferase [Hydrogenispora ethanolica]
MTIHFRKLRQEEFPAVYDLMKLSFPAAELRSCEEALALLNIPDYQVLVVEKGTILQAFLAEWALPDFHYIEHFAVNPAARGAGLGTRIMQEYLDQANLPVVIEVEAAATVNAKRRIAFYQRLGFVLSDLEYVQPPLRKMAPGILLRLMHYPGGMSQEALLEAKQSIFRAVYSRSTG